MSLKDRERRFKKAFEDHKAKEPELTESQFIEQKIYCLEELLITQENVNPTSLIGKSGLMTEATGSTRRQIRFYKRKLENLNYSPLSSSHPRIFTSPKAYQMFEHLSEPAQNKALAEYSFIYRAMQKDGLIHSNVGESEFREWLRKEKSIELHSQLKSYSERVTPIRKNAYSLAYSHFIKAEKGSGV